MSPPPPYSSTVLILDPLFSEEAVRAALAALDVDVRRGPDGQAAGGVTALLTGSDYQLPRERLDDFPDLRVIATASVGVDHLPLDEAAERGIWVCNVPTFCTAEVADSTLAMILAVCRGTVFLDRETQRGVWNSRGAGKLHRIAGRRLGLVGFGRIGQAVALRAGAFGFEIWAHDSVMDGAAARRLGVRPSGMREIFSMCDLISIHAPWNETSGPIIGDEELDMMQTGSILINTSRGPLVDAPAVLGALDRGRLAGAALDVLPVEPPSNENPVPSHPRLIVTPHSAWYSEEAMAEAYSAPIAAVEAVLSGGSPKEGVVVTGRST